MMTYLLFMLPGILFGLYAQSKVQSSFRKYSNVSFRNGLTGAAVARQILRTNGIHDVQVEETQGFLSDHYDPRSKTLRLSPQVYGGRSVAAAGIAAHEVGHAIQHAQHYGPLGLRSALVPAAKIGSSLWMWLFLAGGIMGMTPMGQLLMLSAIVVFSGAVLFQLVTLPVEFDASARALGALESGGILAIDERKGAKDVLDAAFLTYVAGLVSSVMLLLYMVMRSGLLGSQE